MGDGLRGRYGPWAVVTGASEGIGRQLAVRLAEAGLDLVLVARREAVLEAMSVELSGRHGVLCKVVAADLASPAGWDQVCAETEALDVGLLVAAAGFGSSGHFIEGDLVREQAMLSVNCAAVLHMSHVFGRRFVSRRRGGIVLLGSIVGFQGVPGSAHYAATKAWVQSLAEGLHHELGPLGVDVLSSAPGPVASGFAARADMRMGRTVSPDAVAVETLAALGHRLTVRPGWLTKLLSLALATAPRALRVRIMQQVMGGMIRHHGELTTTEAS